MRTPFHPPDSELELLEAQKEFDRRLVTQFVPATVFVNDELKIVHTRGNVSRYLKLARDAPACNILKMARESLLIELRNALAGEKGRRGGTERRRAAQE